MRTLKDDTQDLAISVPLPVKVTIFAFSSSPSSFHPFCSFAVSACRGPKRRRRKRRRSRGRSIGGSCACDYFFRLHPDWRAKGRRDLREDLGSKRRGKENRKWDFNSSCAHSAHLLQKRYSMKETWACFLFGLPIFFSEQQRGNGRQRWTMVRGDDPWLLNIRELFLFHCCSCLLLRLRRLCCNEESLLLWVSLFLSTILSWALNWPLSSAGGRKEGRRKWEEGGAFPNGLLCFGDPSVFACFGRWLQQEKWKDMKKIPSSVALLGLSHPATS